jgi:amidase
MRRIIRRSAPHVLLSLALVASRAALAQQPTTAALAGTWIFQMEGDNQPQRVTLSAAGDSLLGNVYGQAFGARVRSGRLQFMVGSYRWWARIAGDSLSGWLVPGKDSSTWRASRIQRPAAARHLRLVPSGFSRTLSATIPAALRLFPGDTVSTRTIDAGGWGLGAFGDRANKLTMGGNPLTGPFYVEDAVPGDVLVIRLHRVRLNRTWAFSGRWLMDFAVQPGYAAERKWTDGGNQWTLDTLAGVARLAEPSPALRSLTIPLRPFLGVVAVAPGGDAAPSSRDSGPFGGNMEYSQLREGTTVYLPVTTLGAYLYIGDGHAAQGDGELTGDAMETSMDVTFSVEVQRARFVGIPRAESAEDLMSIGVAGSLDEAMRSATTDMARWLERDFAITANDAAILLGFAAKYDIPDLVPPYVGVSLRVPKSALATLPLRR